MDAAEHHSAAPALAPTVAALGDAPRTAFRRLVSLGVGRVQLSAGQPGLRPRDLDRSGRRDLLATLRRDGLEVSGLDAWIPPAHLLEPARADRAVEAMGAAIRLARDLGGVAVSCTLPAEDDDARSIARVLVEQAHGLDVRLADHALSAPPRPGAGIGIDPAAVLAAGEDPAAAVSMMAASLVSVRLCDLLRSGLRGPIGDPQDGRLDVEAYGAALDAAGYRRPVVVDLRQWSDPWPGLERTMERWARLG